MSHVRPQKVVVVGGGISGLATAWNLQRLAFEQGVGLDLTLLEAADRLGGTIRTEAVRTEAGTFRVEWGPNGFLDSKPETLQLCEELGLTDELIGSDDSSAKRYLLLGGKLQQLPRSPGAFLRSPILSFGARMRVMREPFVAKGPDEDESVFDFAARRLGPQAAERLIDPFVSGIFAGDPKALSVKAAFPRLPELEQSYGSLIKAQKALKKQRAAEAKEVTDHSGGAGPKGRLTSFPNGMGHLVRTLEERLGPTVRTGARVERIRRFDDGWVVDGPSETYAEGADHVVLATPAFASLRMLSALDRGFTEPLGAVDYAAVAVVCLGFRDEDLEHDLDGFGFLIPAIEERRILGCLWTSSIFPGHRAPEGHKLLRVMIGGARAPERALRPEGELVSLALRELKEHLGIRGEPVMTRLIRWTSAIPQYGLGHLDRLAELDDVCARWPGLHLTGNAYRGVGVNDCTRNAVRVATSILQPDD